jgi:ubiquinone/menaquinone biosynthesis C-methylase UbiE
MTIADSGERMIPAFHKGSFAYGEHVARYYSIAPWMAEKVVLDIACGSGYGSQLLAKSAQKVYGVDISEESIEYAKRRYPADNLEYRVGDAVMIPLDDASVDVVVCYETIGHIQDYRKFLKEIKRVLRPEGQLILSAPNRDQFSETNHFHLHEFRLGELRDLLKSFFKNQSWCYEDTWLYSAVVSEAHFTGEPTWDLKTIKAMSGQPETALYFVVVCSDVPITIEPTEIGVITQHWSAKEQIEVEQYYRRRIQELVDHIPDAEEMMSRFKLTQKELKEAKTALDGIYRSKAWRIVQVLRKIWRLVIFWKP